MKRKIKKRYTKPQVTKIKLETKEAVLGICKTQTMTASQIGACSNPLVEGCYSAGS